jgi:hypothetical protein
VLPRLPQRRLLRGPNHRYTAPDAIREAQCTSPLGRVSELFARIISGVQLTATLTRIERKNSLHLARMPSFPSRRDRRMKVNTGRRFFDDNLTRAIGIDLSSGRTVVLDRKGLAMKALQPPSLVLASSPQNAWEYHLGSRMLRRHAVIRLADTGPQDWVTTTLVGLRSRNRCPTQGGWHCRLSWSTRECRHGGYGRGTLLLRKRISSRPEITPGALENAGDRNVGIAMYLTRTKRQRWIGSEKT